MKRVKKLTNTSNENITLDMKDGLKMVIPPGAGAKDVEISNSQQLQGKVKMTFDLTEVNEVEGRMRLLD